MKILLSWIVALALLGMSAKVKAQEDTAHHRAVYQTINDHEKSYRKVKTTWTDRPLEVALTGYLEGGEVRKIVALSDDDGGGTEEFYLDGGKLLFVYSTYLNGRYGKQPVRLENRFYFADGRIFKWLSNEKPAPTLGPKEYATETERLTKLCREFVAALKRKAG